MGRTSLPSKIVVRAAYTLHPLAPKWDYTGYVVVLSLEVANNYVIVGSIFACRSSLNISSWFVGKMINC